MAAFINVSVLEFFNDEDNTAHFTRELNVNVEHIVYIETPYDLRYFHLIGEPVTRIVLANGESFIIQGAECDVLEGIGLAKIC